MTEQPTGGFVTIPNDKPGIFDALSAAGHNVEYRHAEGGYWSSTPVETQAFIDGWSPTPTDLPVPVDGPRWAWREALRRIFMLDGVLAALPNLPPMWADREQQPIWTTDTMKLLASSLPSPIPSDTVDRIARLQAWIAYTEGQVEGTNGFF